jgi:hypothetical protein
MIALIRSSLLALSQANETGNYTVLRDLGAPGFQASNTAARLAAVFSDLRDRNVEMLGVAYLTPQISGAPVITPQGLLLLTGLFPTQPEQINFQLSYQVAGGRWRLFGITVNPVQAAALVPDATAPTAAKATPRPAAPPRKP